MCLEDEDGTGLGGEGYMKGASNMMVSGLSYTIELKEKSNLLAL